MEFGDTCMLDGTNPDSFTDVPADYDQPLDVGTAVSADAAALAANYAAGASYDALPGPVVIEEDLIVIPDEVAGRALGELGLTGADDKNDGSADPGDTADNDETVRDAPGDVEEDRAEDSPETADEGSGSSLPPPGSETALGDAGDDGTAYPALKAAYRKLEMPGEVLGEIDAEPSEPTIARGQPLLQEVERMKGQGAPYPGLEAAYNITVPEVLGELSLEDTGLPGEEASHTEPEERTWLTYPIPQGLLHNTDGANSFFVDGEQIEEGDTTESSEGKIVLAYNSLDYRVRIALAEGGDRYTGRDQAFDGLRQLSKKRRAFGRAGDKAEAGIREIIDGQLENVGDYGNRWFVVSQFGEGNKTRLWVDYYCLERVTERTFQRYDEGLGTTGYDASGALLVGSGGRKGLGESGRGISIIATHAMPEDQTSTKEQAGTDGKDTPPVKKQAGIEWIEPYDDPEDNENAIIDDNPDRLGDRWTHMWFVVDNSDYEENELFADLEGYDAMSRGEKDAFSEGFLRGMTLSQTLGAEDSEGDVEGAQDQPVGGVDPKKMSKGEVDAFLEGFERGLVLHHDLNIDFGDDPEDDR